MRTIERRVAALEAFMAGIQHARYTGFVPVAVTNLSDGTTTWSGGTIAAGTYAFSTSNNGTLWPTSAKALAVFLYAQWGTASASNIASLRKAAAGTTVAQVRAQVASIGAATTGIVPLSSGDFVVIIEGAAPTTTVLRAVGYFT